MAYTASACALLKFKKEVVMGTVTVVTVIVVVVEVSFGEVINCYEKVYSSAATM